MIIKFKDGTKKNIGFNKQKNLKNYNEVMTF
jgi:hypothetical protein